MATTQKPLQTENFKTLCDMGYSVDIVTEAFKDCKTKSLEEALELLLVNESYYKKKALKTSKKDTKRDRTQSQEFEDGPTLIQFGQPLKASTLGKTKSEGRKPNRKDTAEDKSMEENVSSSIAKIIKHLNVLHEGKDCTALLSDFSEQIKDIKFNTSGSNGGMHKYLASNTYFSQVSDLRNKIFEIIQKLMNMNMKTKVIDCKELEYVLLMVFEMRLLKANQMDIIMTALTKFLTKMGVKQDDIIMNNLDRHFIEASNCIHTGNFGGICSQEEDTKLLEDPILNSCPNLTVINHELEESKDSSSSKNEKKGENVKNGEKEFCVVCKKDIREIVFLPCCHFLTCQGCSGSTKKCQVCSKKIEKNLKIFWS